MEKKVFQTLALAAIFIVGLTQSSPAGLDCTCSKRYERYSITCYINGNTTYIGRKGITNWGMSVFKSNNACNLEIKTKIKTTADVGSYTDKKNNTTFWGI